MADETRNLPATPPKPPATPAKPPAGTRGPFKPAEKGETVRVVLANGSAVPATVTGGRGVLADLSFVLNDADVVITSSPHDPDGLKHDSWHRP